MKIISNVFTMKMIMGVLQEGQKILKTEIVSTEAASSFALTAESSVGHADAANTISAVLGVPVSANRREDVLSSGDQVLVAQYDGPRLPEGVTELPQGARYTFILVTVE